MRFSSSRRKPGPGSWKAWKMTHNEVFRKALRSSEFPVTPPDRLGELGLFQRPHAHYSSPGISQVHGTYGLHLDKPTQRDIPTLRIHTSDMLTPMYFHRLPPPPHFVSSPGSIAMSRLDTRTRLSFVPHVTEKIEKNNTPYMTDRLSPGPARHS